MQSYIRDTTLVYIDDVVNAFLIADDQMEKIDPGSHRSYMISSNKLIKLRDLVKRYEDITGKELPIHWGGRSYRPREVMIPWNKGKVLPGWNPSVSLEEGLRKIIKY
jgi:nucleoside-diphosphate-sugar epimerase